MADKKSKKRKYKSEEGDTVYDLIHSKDPKVWPRHSTGYRAISPRKEDKLEFFKDIGLVKTAGYKTRKAKHNA